MNRDTMEQVSEPIHDDDPMTLESFRYILSLELRNTTHETDADSFPGFSFSWKVIQGQAFKRTKSRNI